MRPVSIPAAHAAVLGATVWLTATAGLGLAGTAAALALAVSPLLLAVRGLLDGSRYTGQWVAIAMVFYVGFGLAETVASQGRSLAAIVLFFCSAAELLLLLRWLRSVPRASRGSAEP